MKRIFVITVICMLMFTIGCASNGETASATQVVVEVTPEPTPAPTPTPTPTPTPIKIEGDVGILMPNQEHNQWVEDSNNLKETLEMVGCSVDLQFADNDIDTQKSQIEAMITLGVDAIVITPVDAYALNKALKAAKEAGILIIDFNSLIMNTGAVDYFVAYDSEMIGAMQGQYIVDSLGVTDETEEVYTLEFFAGAPDNIDAMLFHNGAIDVLTPYIESGALVVKSGKGKSSKDWKNVATKDWSTEAAQNRMSELLKSYYKDESIDAVLCANDSMAQGIAAALEADGYGSESKPYPILTGQDCDMMSIQNIRHGKQSMTISKSPDKLVERTTEILIRYFSGAEIVVDKTFDNNAMDVPACLGVPVVVDIDNYEDYLN